MNQPAKRRIHPWAWAAALVLAISLLSCTRSLDKDHFQVSIELYNDGCDLYEKRDFDGARERFLAAGLTRWQHPALFYNLGNTYYRLGDWGRSILYYEKAKELSPRDESIEHNLRVVQERIIDKVTRGESSLVGQVFVGLYRMFTVNEWTYITLVVYLVTIALILILILVRRKKHEGSPENGAKTLRKITARAAVVALVILLYCASNTAVAIHSHSCLVYGVVVVDSQPGRSGPADSFAEVFEVHSGTKIRVLREDEGGNWYQVKLPNGLSGWLPKPSLGII